MMRAIVLSLALSASAALVCEDLSSCEGCVAKRFDENAPSCKAWGPKKCTRKDDKNRWEAEWCPGDPCEEFPECDCVGEKANGARKCLKARDEAQCDTKDGGDKWTTNWCGSTAPPTTAQPTVTPPVTNQPTAYIVNCFRDYSNSADWCGMCCPACTAVDKDSLEEAFDGGEATGSIYVYNIYQFFGFGHTFTTYSNLTPKVPTKCICLDLDFDHYFESSEDVSWFNSGSSIGPPYFHQNKGGIELTDLGDCARVKGGRNDIYAKGGNDAIYSPGAYNYLWGGDGDDHITAGNIGGYIMADTGENGDADVCQDLSFVKGDYTSELRFGGACETCLDTAGEDVLCPEFFRRKLTHAAGLESGGAEA